MQLKISKMMLIKEKLDQLLKTLPPNVQLVAVSKTKPISDIQEAYDAGQRDFGENRIQEMVNKYEELPKDIQWHMIGHLQKNKIKYMSQFVHLIHGVDSLEKLIEINKQAKKHDRTIKCLLQVKIAQENSKFGLNEEEVVHILQSQELKTLNNIKIDGLMGMSTFTSDVEQVSYEFRSLKTFFDKLNNTLTLDLKILSMGMSGDYKIAIKFGSNMIRVGSAIFGERHYIA
jgi:pyridoxal phosphate enzyme (YggS family)